MQKGRLPLSASAPDYTGAAPWPPHLSGPIWHGDRPQVTCFVPIPSYQPKASAEQRVSRALCPTMCVYTCAHVHTHACMHTYVHTLMHGCTQPRFHLGALYVPGISLNIPHTSCTAHPSKPSSTALSCLVMPAFGCSLIAPQRPPAPGTLAGPANLFLCNGSQDFLLFCLHAHRSRALLRAFPHCTKAPPHPYHTGNRFFLRTRQRAWNPVKAWGTLTRPWKSKTELKISGFLCLSPSLTDGGLSMALASSLSFFVIPWSPQEAIRLVYVWFRKLSHM